MCGEPRARGDDGVFKLIIIVIIDVVVAVNGSRDGECDDRRAFEGDLSRGADAMLLSTRQQLDQHRTKDTRDGFEGEGYGRERLRGWRREKVDGAMETHPHAPGLPRAFTDLQPPSGAWSRLGGRHYFPWPGRQSAEAECCGERCMNVMGCC